MAFVNAAERESEFRAATGTHGRASDFREVEEP